MLKAGKFSKLWIILSDGAFSSRLLSTLAALLVVGWGARIWLDGPVAAFHPVGAYRVRMLGLADIFASGWFAAFCVLFGVASLARALRSRSDRRWMAMVAELGLMLAPMGIAISAMTGVQARATVDESGQVDYVELIRGDDKGWKPLLMDGKVIEGFRVPGFVIQAGERGVFHFVRDGRLVESKVVAPAHPARFDGMTVHLDSVSRAAGFWADITVRSARDGVEREFRGLAAGKRVNLEGFGFSVLEVEPKTDEADPSARIEYQEAGKEPERFWILQKFKDHDAIKRKRSAQHFALGDVRPRSTVQLILSKDPGRYLLWLGLALFSAFGLLEAVSRLRSRAFEGRVDAFVAFGLPILTVHLVLISVWAYDSRGFYWSWSGSWIASLVAWLLVASFARARENKNVSGI